MDIIYGRNPVSELLKSDNDIDKIYINKEISDPSLKSLLTKAKEKRLIISYCTREKLDELCQTTKHQGIAAMIPQTKYVSITDILNYAKEKDEPPFIFIADEITDPHNLGAIIRTANVCGAHGVIIPKRRSASLSFSVAKTAAGALEYVPVAKVANLPGTIDDLKKRGLWIYGADMDGTCWCQQDYNGPVGLVIGSEGNGIGRLVKEKCDFIVSLPMKGNITSLNASVAAGILMYEISRQRSDIKAK